MKRTADRELDVGAVVAGVGEGQLDVESLGGHVPGDAVRPLDGSMTTSVDSVMSGRRKRLGPHPAVQHPARARREAAAVGL